jgi:uncharacterized protein
MKLGLILLVVLVTIWLWRSKRQSDPKLKQEQARAKVGKPQEIVCCALCSVHVPSGDALQGKNGAYCSPEHLHRAEP